MFSSKLIFKKINIRKNNIIINSQNDNRQIFQIYPPINNVTICDINDCNKYTKNMILSDKIDIYYSNGIDYNRVYKYQNFIEILNKNYYNQQYIQYPYSDISKTFKNMYIICKIIFYFIIK